MRNNNDGQKQQGDGFIPTSFRALSNYMRIVSSGASTVASTVRSAAASAIADRDNDGSQEVLWAGFDKLENEDGITRQVLLLGYRSGFQVWDVEEADNVHGLVSKHDDPVFFMQMLPQPITSKRSDDLFADSRPLLAVSADGSPSGAGDTVTTAYNGMTSNCPDPVNGGLVPTVVRFYSLISQSYVHVLKFRSRVYAVRSSSRIVAVSQATQIHCFNAATLDKEYTILTNPVVSGYSGFGGIGYGPLAVGPRWLAYSGSPAEFSNSGRVSSQHLPPASYPSKQLASNGSLVAHYAKESSKQLAAGIFTLGDIGCKKLSKYYSELLPDSSSSPRTAGLGGKVSGAVSGHSPDTENEGMVIVRDVVSKSVIAQFRAHRSPISSLCFDPSGILLVTASVQGHNINVFRIMPGLVGSSSGADAETCYAHLYTLQRGITNAVIQDISFSYDSHWIVVTSSRGTSHLFAISPSGGPVVFQPSYDCLTDQNRGMTKPGGSWPPTSGLQILNPQNLSASGPPITLSVVCRIRSGASTWRGAAAAATGMNTSQFGAVASAFHKCKGNVLDAGTSPLKARYHLLVFSPCSLIQYALRASLGSDSVSVGRGLSSPYDMASESDAKFLVEAIQKWNIRKKHTQGVREDATDIYGESSKSFSEVMEGEFSGHDEAKDLVTNNKSNMKSSTEEKHNFFISEAELQMHQLGTPLWARPQIYFQSMTIDGAEIDSDASRGEFEIEKIPAFMIEARSKSFVPVCDHLQTPSVNQTRTSSPAGSITTDGRRLQHQTSALSQKAVVLGSSSSGTNESMNEGDVAVTYLHSGGGALKEEAGLEGPPRMVAETPVAAADSVNNNDSLVESSSPPLEIVNNSESSVKEGDNRIVDGKIDDDFKSENNQLEAD